MNGSEDIESLVNSLFDLNRKINVSDVKQQISQFEDPIDIIAYTNRVLSVKKLGFRKIIKFGSGVEEYLLGEQHNQIPKAREQREKEREAKYIDELTKMPNRRAIEEKMQTKKKRYSILMLDIDHFRKYNNSYGHLVGDIVLKNVAHIIARNVRKTEKYIERFNPEKNGFAGRYGGEEFYVQLNNVGKYDAGDIVAKRIKEDIEENATKLICDELEKKGLSGHAERFRSEKVTTSVGVADEEQGQGAEHARMLVDAALYWAKNTGRNNVKIYDPKSEFCQKFLMLKKKS